MKEFNLILDKVSHALGMTVNNVVKLYPQLRVEYSWYYVCDNLQDISIIVGGIILAVCGVVLLPMILLNCPDDDGYVMAVKVGKLALGVVGVLAVVLLISTVLKGFMCPDIMIIKEFIK